MVEHEFWCWVQGWVLHPARRKVRRAVQCELSPRQARSHSELPLGSVFNLCLRRVKPAGLPTRALIALGALRAWTETDCASPQNFGITNFGRRSVLRVFFIYLLSIS